MKFFCSYFVGDVNAQTSKVIASKYHSSSDSMANCLKCFIVSWATKMYFVLCDKGLQPAMVLQFALFHKMQNNKWKELHVLFSCIFPSLWQKLESSFCNFSIANIFTIFFITRHLIGAIFHFGSWVTSFNKVVGCFLFLFTFHASLYDKNKTSCFD